MDQEKKLRAFRGGHRGAVVNLVRKIDAALARTHADISPMELPNLTLYHTNLS